MTVCRRTLQHTRSRGFSLIELMVALTVGLILITGLMSLVVGNMQGYGELNKAGYQAENARYASQFLRDELSMAGYYGNLTFMRERTTGDFDPCETGLDAVKDRFDIAIQGEDDVNTSGSGLGCRTGMAVKAGTDILLLRRASSTAILPTARDAGKYYLASNITLFDVLAGQASTSGISYLSDPLFSRVRRFYERIIYVSSCSVCTGSATDTIPTLKMIELENGAWSDPVPLVEGVDDLQVEYGLDGGGDGASETWVALPGDRDEWLNVVAVRFHLLMRNTEGTQGFSDTKVYSMGLESLNTPKTVGPFNDGFKRHVYSMTVRLRNMAQRRES